MANVIELTCPDIVHSTQSVYTYSSTQTNLWIQKDFFLLLLPPPPPLLWLMLTLFWLLLFTHISFYPTPILIRNISVMSISYITLNACSLLVSKSHRMFVWFFSSVSIIMIVLVNELSEKIRFSKLVGFGIFQRCVLCDHHSWFIANKNSKKIIFCKMIYRFYVCKRWTKNQFFDHHRIEIYAKKSKNRKKRFL